MADQDNDEGEWTESGDRVRYYRFRNKLKKRLAAARDKMVMSTRPH